jgi:hypothetical protein
VSVEILDLTGKTMLNENLAATEERIDIRRLGSGVYIARIHDGDNSSCVKLVVR